MTTIEISKDITFTASEKTISEYLDIQKSVANIFNSIKSAIEYHDWNDVDEYYYELDTLTNRLYNLGAQGVKLMTRKQLEQKYGVTIVENGYYDCTQCNWKYIKLYDIYSADGCCWERGKRTIKAVEYECKYWAHSLLQIKKLVERDRRVV